LLRTVIDQNDLQPADLSWGTDRVTFVMNRGDKNQSGDHPYGPQP